MFMEKPAKVAGHHLNWYRLVEYCILTKTLLLDEDGLYDPTDFNDKIVLGMKGTISEMELHMLQARMRGGLLNKARRGELKKSLPVGFVYDEAGRIRLDPDIRVQDALRLFFETFRRISTVCGTVRYFREQGIAFPERGLKGPRRQQVSWGRLKLSGARRILANLHYAGAYFYGSNRLHKYPDGRRRLEPLPREEWVVFIPEAHPGYITYQEFELNKQRLAQHNTRKGVATVREGTALLQGLAICGRCGGRMAVVYHKYQSGLVPHYVCQPNEPGGGPRICQSLTGRAMDEAVSNLVLAAITPLALEVSLSVQQELEARAQEIDRLRYRQVERAQYEVELAKRRYMQVDPDNRLVAATLEADWNERLCALAAAETAYEQQRQAERFRLDEEKRAQVLALAADFPRLWSNLATPMRERKRVLRLLIEDITLLKLKEQAKIAIQVRFRGGATQRLEIPAAVPFGQTYTTPPAVVAEIDRLLEVHGDEEVARLLNGQGLKSGRGQTFTAVSVASVRHRYGLPSKTERLHLHGMLTSNELAESLGIKPNTVRTWRRQGLLHGVECPDGRYLYQPPDEKLLAQVQKTKTRV
ncbi:MAG: recombinase zinc beta ribbon domain-containing protein [Candidatus Schekmanbacteria bacterium]|nr:recombinase zinc beta ribbon domain-containing protein [Candidatus Schekmanbacteria bacterium]